MIDCLILFFWKQDGNFDSCYINLTHEYIDHPKETKNYTGRSPSSIQFT